MEKLNEFKLTRHQLKLIIGGAEVTANCAGGGTVTCSGASCSSQDANSQGDGHCKCGDDVKRCALL